MYGSQSGDLAGVQQLADAGDELVETVECDAARRGRRDVARNRTEEHDGVERAVLEREVAVGDAGSAEVLDRIVGLGVFGDVLAEAMEALAVQLVDDAVFATEAGVHVHRAHPGLGGDSPNGQRGGPIRLEERPSGIEQGGARLVIRPVHAPAI